MLWLFHSTFCSRFFVNHYSFHATETQRSRSFPCSSQDPATSGPCSGDGGVRRCNTRALLGAPGQFISMSETAFLGQRLSLHWEGYANVLDNLMSRCDHRSVVVELCSAALQYMLSVDRPHVGELQLDLLQVRGRLHPLCCKPPQSKRQVFFWVIQW